MLQAEDPLPYAFHLVPRNTETSRVQINNSILSDALEPAASSSKAPSFSPEDVFELWCEPQAVFRVRSVGRCSATLSGECERSRADSRPRIADIVLCSLADGEVRRNGFWGRDVQSLGHGDGDAKGEHSSNIADDSGHCLGTRDGSCAWNGTRWRKSWLQEGTTDR
jgi:hypothetical protein